MPPSHFSPSRETRLSPAAPDGPTSPRGEADILANRKLIRPSLAGLREQMAKVPAAAPPSGAPARMPKKPVPPEQTNAEAFYYIKQMQAKTPVVLVLQDGERVRGTIEWYDRHCLKIHRQGEPNLLIYKANVKYIYKLEEESAGPASRPSEPGA
ncbi:MAG: Hfq-like protein [Terriglobales bacterium]